MEELFYFFVGEVEFASGKAMVGAEVRDGGDATTLSTQGFIILLYADTESRHDSYATDDDVHDGLFCAVGGYEFSECFYAVEVFFCFLGVREFDAVFAFEDKDYFECVDGVESEPFAKERGFGVDVGRGHFFEVECLDELCFELFYELFHIRI